jgi:hypothetical protein
MNAPGFFRIISGAAPGENSNRMPAESEPEALEIESPQKPLAFPFFSVIVCGSLKTF